MSQQYNFDFNDENAYDMIRFGHESKIHRCGWWSNGRKCNDVVRGGDFASHLRLHGVSNGTRYSCKWGDCDKGEMNKDSLIRHIQEKHLEWRWPCLKCDQVFTRRSVLNTHLRTH